MGYDYAVCKVLKNGEGYVAKECDHETSMNWNFHGPGTEFCGEAIKVWSAREDVNERSGQDIVDRGLAALQILKEKYNIKPAKPEIHTGFYYGIYYCDKQKKKIRYGKEKTLAIFAYHIQRFVDLGRSYPEHYFISDINRGFVTTSDGAQLFFDYQQDEEEDPGVYAFVIHPTKGMMRIDSYKTAMEIYGVCMAMGKKDDAEKWFQFGKTNFPEK